MILNIRISPRWFRRAPRSRVRRGPRIRHRPPAAAPRTAGARAARGVLYGVRYALFLVLMWARGPLRFLLGLVGVPAMFALPLIAFGYEGANKGELLVLCVGAGLGAFVLAWFYDSIVLALSPEPIFLN